MRGDGCDQHCVASVEMIEKFYAAHIKNTLDAAAINVRRPKSVRQVKPIQPAEAVIQPKPTAIEPPSIDV